jgi:hypothetical protein
MGKITQLALAFSVMAFIGFITPQQAGATDARNFNPGRIIDDGIFTNSNIMSVQDIQKFFDSKVTCDTWGAKPSELGEGTRRQWMANRGITPPFRCVTDYYENPSTKENNYGKNDRPSGSISAAQIVYNYSKQFNINPQVIIATLQKENGMITDEWPTPKQFTEAMGFGCPDNVAPGAPACDPAYKSFATQIYQAARHFRGYIDNGPGWYVPYNTGSNSILWNPNQSCGRSTVDIENRATVALYSYTPYRPNQAALNAQYGTGDGCSAYGNRNFYLYFSDWFGSTTQYNGNIILSKSLTVTSSSGTSAIFQGDTVTGSFEVSNTASVDTAAGGLGICARMNGEYYDLGFKDQSIIPGNGKTMISFSKKIDQVGTLHAFICSYHASIGGWASSFYPYDNSGSLSRSVTQWSAANPVLTTNVVLSPSAPVVGQPVTATVTLSNASGAPASAGTLIFAARDPQGNNVDFPADPDLIVPANGTVTYSKTRTFTKTGKHSFFLADFKDNTWSMSYPISSNGSTRSGSFEVKDNPLVSSSPTLSPQMPALGEPATASFTIRNDSPTPINIGQILLAGRDPQGNNVDFPTDNDVIVPANGTYTYSKSRIFSSAGVYRMFIANFNNNKWDMDYPKNADSTITRSANFSIKDNPLVTTGISLSPSQPVAGQPVTIQMSIRNDSSMPVNIGMLVVAARDPKGGNIDYPGDSDLTIPANTTYTYSKTRTLETAGDYNFFIANLKDSKWSFDYPKSISQSIVRKLTVAVKDNPILVEGISLQPENPVRNQDVTATIKLRNDSSAAVSAGMIVIAARDSQGNNVDFPADPDLIVPANSTLTYSKTRKFTNSGLHSFFISSYKNGQWSGDYPKSLNTSIVRSIKKTIGQ